MILYRQPAWTGTESNPTNKERNPDLSPGADLDKFHRNARRGSYLIQNYAVYVTEAMCSSPLRAPVLNTNMRAWRRRRQRRKKISMFSLHRTTIFTPSLGISQTVHSRTSCSIHSSHFLSICLNNTCSSALQRRPKGKKNQHHSTVLPLMAAPRHFYCYAMELPRGLWGTTGSMTISNTTQCTMM